MTRVEVGDGMGDGEGQSRVGREVHARQYLRTNSWGNSLADGDPHFSIRFAFMTAPFNPSVEESPR